MIQREQPTEPELKLSEETNTEIIDQDNDHKKDCNIDCRVSSRSVITIFIKPIFNNKSRRDQIIWSGYNVLNVCQHLADPEKLSVN